jgi:protoheme IX farnesyltransferase
MARTKRRRPLPLGQLTPRGALTFAVGIGVASVIIFAVWFNWLSALLALGTILFYGLFYTLWLKPNTHQNIVIGGAAGAMGPVIGWAAAANNLALAPWLMFLIIFLWTPPHFWALAMYLKEDYVKVRLPMLPVVKGDAFTLRQIWYYTLATVVVSLALAVLGGGWLYGIAAALLGLLFVRKAFVALKAPSKQAEFGLFKYSIVYLLALFASLIVGGFWPRA